MVAFDMTLVTVASPEHFVTGLAGTQHLLCVQIHVVFEDNHIFKNLAAVFARVSLSRVGPLVLFEKTGRQEDSGTVLTAVHLPPGVHTQVQPQLQ